ncbi:MAG TPA: hypothetical protein VE868_07685 [Balneolaceae bacterium]|nr:hypothetical protein [Balneolaceae bacterium]
MLNKLRQIASRHLINIPGWRTDRKIVVIESDDWGSIRMASKEAFNWFLQHGYDVDTCAYNRNDALESNDDLELLFEVLSSVKDMHGNPAVITANNIVANPDFEKIKDSDFKKYFYEPFTKTLNRYPGKDRVIELYNEGMDQNLICPQFHGREHINVNRWMTELHSGNNKVLRDAFQQDMFTVHKSGDLNCKRDHLDAFGMDYEKEWVSIKDIIKSGIQLFEDIWGYRSASFIAPCYVWPVEIESILAENGVKYIQGTHVQRVPLPESEPKISRKYHFMGQENCFDQRYLIRNVSFEPAEYGRKNSVRKALKEIETAFKFKKPAIISSHRVNYIGSIRPENRDENLKLLASLLKRIVERFRGVEFMSTDQLGELITGGE